MKLSKEAIEYIAVVLAKNCMTDTGEHLARKFASEIKKQNGARYTELRKSGSIYPALED